MGIILKAVIIIVGVFLLGDAVFSLAKRRMTESFCLMWGLVSVLTIIGGCIIRPSRLSALISPVSFVIILIIFFLLVYIALFFSRAISELMRKNTELAIRLTLLTQEKDEIREELEKIRKSEENISESVGDDNKNG